METRLCSALKMSRLARPVEYVGTPNQSWAPRNDSAAVAGGSTAILRTAVRLSCGLRTPPWPGLKH
jgi:hypothetical protein